MIFYEDMINTVRYHTNPRSCLSTIMQGWMIRMKRFRIIFAFWYK